LDLAYNATPPSESEDRAWILAQTAHVELVSGDLAKAEQCANEALRRFPDYHYGLAALAQVRQAQGRNDEAAALLLQRYQASPRPENLYALAQAQALAGQQDEAYNSYRKFAAQASATADLPDNSNRELIAYYADRAGDPAKALATARREIARRHDVFTLDSYAWALAANGDYREAEQQMQLALRTGVKDQTVLYHAGSIALHLHKSEEALTYLKDAAARNSRDAAKLLASIGSE
jgi:tetratricopeptide (TPR) repeat protein